METVCSVNMRQWLAEQAESIRAAWLDQIAATYSEEYGRFLRLQNDPFANPAGAIFKDGIRRLYSLVVDGSGMEQYREIVTPMIRLKAVQGMPPSQALAFLPLLKNIIRTGLDRCIQDESLHETLLALETRIDLMVLWAFDVYMECREAIFQLRSNEMKRNVAGLLARYGEAALAPCDPCGTDKPAACSIHRGNGT